MNAIALVTGVLMAGPLQAADASVETVLHSFCSLPHCRDGAAPYDGLIEVNGLLYGTTQEGGGGSEDCEDTSCGTLFSLDPGRGKETVRHVFRNDGQDGWYPFAGLFPHNGVLYGSTWYGGANGYGTIYAFDPATGVENAVHAFQNDGADGVAPYVAPIAAGGTFYGTTSYGGTHGAGTVFSLDRGTGAVTVLHSFCSRRHCGDGDYPLAGLVAVEHRLFGTTAVGGADAEGTVFSVDMSSGAEKVLHSFSGADGIEPLGGLVGANGILYGTASEGGGSCYGGCGVLFSIDPATGVETVEYTFQDNGADGIEPQAGLINVGGKLYGTTASGGSDSRGTVFEFDPASGKEKVLYAFRNDGADGNGPKAALLARNGVLYGTTVYGGAHGNGTVFRIRL